MNQIIQIFVFVVFGNTTINVLKKYRMKISIPSIENYSFNSKTNL